MAALRGLGSNRTPVLVDGRRVATSPSLQDSGVDLNTIPLAAVERIEVLSDGASAVYGSDAIGGVINVILRKDFSGVETTAGLGRPEAASAEEEDASIVAGISTGDSRMLFGASYTNKKAIFLCNRDYSRGQLGPQNAGISGFGNTILNADFSDTLEAPDAGCQENLRYYRLVDDVGNFTGIQGAAMCGFDFTQFAADTTELTLQRAAAGGSRRVQHGARRADQLGNAVERLPDRRRARPLRSWRLGQLQSHRPVLRPDALRPRRAHAVRTDHPAVLTRYRSIGGRKGPDSFAALPCPRTVPADDLHQCGRAGKAYRGPHSSALAVQARAIGGHR